MPTRHIVLAGLLGLLGGAVLPVRAADDARQLFDSIYGAELQRVRATPTPADDIELARQMTTLAGSKDTHLDVVPLLCDEAYRLASGHPAGRPVAIDAMNTLAARVPGRAASATAAALDLHEVWFNQSRGEERTRVGRDLLDRLTAAADASVEAERLPEAAEYLRRALGVASSIDKTRRDALLDRLKDVRAELAVCERVDRAKQRIKANPQDAAAATELVRLLLVELNKPDEARKYSFLADQPTRDMLAIAGADLASAKPEQLLTLGGWYEGLADTAERPGSVGAMKLRAIDAYERFLEAHDGQGLERTKALMSVKKLRSDITQSPAAGKIGAVPSGRSYDLLAKVDKPDELTAKGVWSLKDGVLVSGPGQYDRIELPIEPMGEFELSAEMRWVRGRACFGLIVPVNGQSIAATVAGGDRPYAGVYHINKVIHFQQLADTIEPNRWYAFSVRVREQKSDVQIEVRLDGKAVLAWTGDKSKVTNYPYWQLKNPKRVGVASWLTETEARKVQLRVISGDAKAE